MVNKTKKIKNTSAFRCKSEAASVFINSQLETVHRLCPVLISPLRLDRLCCGMKRIAVYCGSNKGVRPEYAAAAQALGTLLAR